MYGTLPTLGDLGTDEVHRYGLEYGSGAKPYHIQFVLGQGYISLELKRYGLGGGVGMTTVLPSDYDTADHHYSLKANKGIVEFWIDHQPKAFGILGPTGYRKEVEVKSNTEPYPIFLVPWGFHGKAPLKLENNKGSTPMEVSDVSVHTGQARPARRFQLFVEDSTTKWNNYDTGGTVQTSHPVPIWGYPNKTLYFKADAGGDLDIEVYVGDGWEVYDTVSLTANELENYPFPREMQAPLMRCVYTPTDADTILLGEVDLA